MRLLKFNVNAQQITKDQNCDFSGLVAGTSGYLRAHFTFSNEWDNCAIAASFWRGSKEYAVIVKDGECDIPPEALTGSTFKVSATGLRGGYCITTNRALVRQEVHK